MKTVPCVPELDKKGTEEHLASIFQWLPKSDHVIFVYFRMVTVSDQAIIVINFHMRHGRKATP